MTDDINSLYDALENIDKISDRELLKDIAKKSDRQYISNLFWENRRIYLEQTDVLKKERALAKCKLIQVYLGAVIPSLRSISSFRTPYGIGDIYISPYAKIGTGCTVFPNVIIGSNTISDSKKPGFPVIGNNCYIGAGAVIIGGVRIGNNVRVGAGCCIVDNVPDNSTVVAGSKAMTIRKDKLNSVHVTEDMFIKQKNEQKSLNADKPFPKIINKETEHRFRNAFKLVFTGDLILLEDQVRRAYKKNGYDFSEMFEYAEDYLKSDLTVGVFEGPMAGGDKGYTSGTLNDKKKLYLNFPDEFGYAVKRAGFDVVTTANNHLLDMGEEGMRRTLDVMDKIGIAHIGTYRSAEEKEKNRCIIIEKNGIRLAFLAYTSFCNYIPHKEFISGRLSYATSFISGTSGDVFLKLKNLVKADFDYAKSFSPDLIVVMPHVGTQFMNEPNNLQRIWFDVFEEYGADIILGCHSHSVQPIEFYERNGKTVFKSYCPGNFANSYRKIQGDISAVVEVYIDRVSKKVIGGGIVPLYTQSNAGGNFRALPVYEMEYNYTLRKQISTDDYDRAITANETVTKVMLGQTLHISNIEKHYLFNENNIYRHRVDMEYTKKSEMLSYLRKFGSICFIGDSITEGSMNNGVPWYEPILCLLDKNMIIYNLSVSGNTTVRLLKNIRKAARADIYVVAVGTNDVRYRKEGICAMTSDEYAENILKIRNELTAISQGCKFIFVAPWTSTDGDYKYCSLSYNDKIALNNEYSEKLRVFCMEHNDIFADCNGYINEKFKEKPQEFFLVDYIHPNASNGVRLYSEAFLECVP